MAQVMVGTSMVSLPLGGRGRPVIQNLGPGKVAFDSEPNVTMSSGLVLAVGAVYECPTDGASETGLSLIADTANTDVRVIIMGA